MASTRRSPHPRDPRRALPFERPVCQLGPCDARPCPSLGVINRSSTAVIDSKRWARLGCVGLRNKSFPDMSAPKGLDYCCAMLTALA